MAEMTTRKQHGTTSRPHPFVRTAVALAMGAATILLLPASLSWVVRAVAGWDVGLLVYLVATWHYMYRSDAEETRRRAAEEDPGSFGVLLIALAVSAIGLVATVVLLRGNRAYVPDDRVGWLIAVCFGAVVGGWILLHTAFTFHYARLYYDDTETEVAGGLDFPGDPPDELDFAYFAFTLGMTYQTSDVTITRRIMRRVVLLHAVLSFAFNTTILALLINVILGNLE